MSATAALGAGLGLTMLLVAGCSGGGGGGGGSTAPMASAVMAWDQNNEPDLAGYRVYRATGPGAYGAPVASLSPLASSYSATNLQAGTTYYFVVTAYDAAGNESPRSNELLVIP